MNFVICYSIQAFREQNRLSAWYLKHLGKRASNEQIKSLVKRICILSFY